MESLKHFKITIEEMVSQTFDVYAKDDEDAETIVIENYNNGAFVLSPGNLVAKQMKIDNITDNEFNEWIEF